MLANAIKSILSELPSIGARVPDKTERSSPTMASASESTRLYRCQPSETGERAMPEWIKQGQNANGHTEAQGRWFVADPSMLDWYKEDVGDDAIIVAVDVPTADLELYRVSTCTEQLGHRSVKSYSRDPENEFFLPRELADRAQPEKSDYERMLDEAAEMAKYRGNDHDRGGPVR